MVAVYFSAYQNSRGSDARYQQFKIMDPVDRACRSGHGHTSTFPITERYGLSIQMNRAADSIPSNISEGAGRNSRKEFLHFLSIANGSSYELQSQIVICNKLGYLKQERTTAFLKELEELQKMNYSLQKKLRSNL